MKGFLFMIIEPFNLIHILSFTVLPAGLFCLLFLLLRNKTQDKQRRVLFIICCFNAALYAVYKFYQAFFYDGYDFIFAYNLPLHFCNLNLILLPLAIWLRNKVLMAYQIYFGTLLAFFALFTIDPAFRGEPFFEFTCLVYFYYHGMLAVMPLTLLAFKQCTPAFKTAWKPVALMVAVTFVMHIVNVTLRVTGLAEEANYFFTFGLRGDPFTEIFWRIVPFNFFFLIPALLVVFVPYICLITLPFHLKGKPKH
jgi:uncharacterized membrane protein YwaF